MIEIREWVKRGFSFDQPIDVFPALLERLRGTPARAKELVGGLSEDMLARRTNGKWSAKEHLGHLVDLQPLDERRLHEFLARTRVISAADMSNRATEHGNHRQTPVARILRQLRAGREELVRKLEALTAEEAGISLSIRVCKDQCACWTGSFLLLNMTIITWRKHVERFWVQTNA